MTTYPRWFAVHTRPNAEPQADAELRRLGYWTFYPFIRQRQRHKRPNCNSYSIRWVERPYFSRYLFLALRAPSESLYPANEAHSVSTVVYCAGEPLEIPHKVMDELMARADEAGQVGSVDLTARPKLRPGQTISPLDGLIAQVKLDTGKEIRAWVELFGSRREAKVTPRTVAKIA